MEQKAREILKASLQTRDVSRVNPVQAIRRHVGPFGGVDLIMPPREPIRRPKPGK